MYSQNQMLCASCIYVAFLTHCLICYYAVCSDTEVAVHFYFKLKKNKVEGWTVHVEAELDEWVYIQSSEFAGYLCINLGR